MFVSMKHKKETLNMSPIIKIILAVLLLLTLADMPGSFNYWAKIASAAAFLYLAYDYFRTKRNVLGITFVALALAFQPFYEISLVSTFWNYINIVVVVGLAYLIISAFGKKK